MWKYLKAAFLLPWKVPGLGGLPVNVLALVAAGIFGAVVWPPLLPVVAGAEMLYLFGFATNGRFQNWVRATENQVLDDGVESRRRALIAQLSVDEQQRLASIDTKATKVVTMYRTLNTDNYVVDTTREALQKLSWVYLKLLIARHYLLSPESQANEKRLRMQVAQLQKDLEPTTLSPSLRESKEATLSLCQRRLDNLERRDLSLQELDSDLMRIDAQVDLALEEATMRGQPHAVSANIDFVSKLLDVGSFGSADEAVSDLDAQITSPVPEKQ